MASVGWGDEAWGEDPWGDGLDDGGVTPPPPPPIRQAPVLSRAEIDELGVDFDILDGLKPEFTLVRGRPNLARAIARRLQTPEGFLAESFGGDPDYGLDVRSWLNRDFSLDQISALESRVKDEVEKDPRVLEAEVVVTYVLASSSLEIEIHMETAVGPFELVLAVTSLTVEMISLSEPS